MIARIQIFRWPRLAASVGWRLALILFFAGAFATGAGAAGDYLVDVWTSENGLPDSSVTALAQTPDGYLWVGTYNGVARFDGVRFVTFDPANTPALTHARVRRLSVDNRGVLWISAYDGSLTKFENGAFTLEHRYTRAAEGDVTFVASSSNQVVFLTSRGELLRKPLTAPAGEGWEELPPPARGIGALCCEDGNGTLWYRDGDRHLWRLTGGGFESLPDAAGLAGQNINCLTTDARGRLWVGTDHEFAFWDGAKFQSAVPAGADAALDVAYLNITESGHVWAVANGSVCEAFENRWRLPPDAARNIFPATPAGLARWRIITAACGFSITAAACGTSARTAGCANWPRRTVFPATAFTDSSRTGMATGGRGWMPRAWCGCGRGNFMRRPPVKIIWRARPNPFAPSPMARCGSGC